MDVAKQGGLWTKIKPAKPTHLQQEARIGLLFLAPWLIGFVLLKALPILAALIFSLTDFKMLSPETTKFVGLENYLHFFRDSEAGASLFGSLRYFLLTVPLEMILALALAAVFTRRGLSDAGVSDARSAQCTQRYRSTPSPPARTLTDPERLLASACRRGRMARLWRTPAPDTARTTHRENRCRSAHRTACLSSTRSGRGPWCWPAP